MQIVKSTLNRRRFIKTAALSTGLAAINAVAIPTDAGPMPNADSRKPSAILVDEVDCGKIWREAALLSGV